MSIWLALEPGTQTVVLDDDAAPLQPLNVKPVSAGAVRRLAQWTPDVSDVASLNQTSFSSNL